MMLAGSVVGIVVIALLIVIVAKLRGSRGLDSKPMTSSNSLPPMPHNNSDDHHHQQQESPDSSDKNPDIIPHSTTLEEWQEANKQIYGSMHYRIPTMQPQTAAAYNPTANGMIIYSGATLGRPHMNNNFKRIDSNGICAQQVSSRCDAMQFRQPEFDLHAQNFRSFYDDFGNKSRGYFTEMCKASGFTVFLRSNFSDFQI